VKVFKICFKWYLIRQEEPIELLQNSFGNIALIHCEIIYCALLRPSYIKIFLSRLCFILFFCQDFVWPSPVLVGARNNDLSQSVKPMP